MNIATVYIEKEIAPILNRFLQSHTYNHITILVDARTKKYCYPLIKASLPKHLLITIKSGEEYKNLNTCQEIWQQLTDRQLDRKALVINLGGGVIGDMGGFCASTYKRGIDFIQVPTTLLAQVDASVGGKLGIDFNGFKNHIGVFKDPVAVLVATEFLNTLPVNEIRSGFAEIIKHCLIADPDMWHRIRKRDLVQQQWEELVSHSIQIKQTIVQQDPTEKGLRKVLNLGHTIGHAVESYFLAQPKKKLLHGEAIAVGMIAESFLANQKGLLNDKDFSDIEEFLFAIYGKVKIKAEDIEAIAPLALQDKKNAEGKIQSVLLKGIGEPLIDQVLSIREIKDALDYYKG
jgi:3-dehydroquinate synthase